MKRYIYIIATILLPVFSQAQFSINSGLDDINYSTPKEYVLQTSECSASASNVDFSIFPTGHMWWPAKLIEREYCKLLKLEIFVDSILLEIRPALGYASPQILYHETTAEAAEAIIQNGFKVSAECKPECTLLACR